METIKQSRAEKMAASYADILIKAGVIKTQQQESIASQVLHKQILRGEVNWWQVCIGQIQNK